MAGYLNGYIIVNVAYNVLIIAPIFQYDFIPTILYSRSDICFVIIEIEFAIFFNGLWAQVEIYHTFTTVFGFVFYHKEFITVKFIAYFLASS